MTLRTEKHLASDLQIHTRVIGTSKGIAPVTRQTVVAEIAILIRIARYRRVRWTPAAIGHKPRKLPPIEDCCERFLSVGKGVGRFNGGYRQPVTLVGDAGAALALGGVGILHGHRLSGD